jgi:hypothetical protein
MARPKRQEADRVLLQALACGATVEHAARKAGVGERTVYRRLAEADFARRLRDLRTEMVQRTASMLTGAGMGAVKTLVDLQADVAVAAGVRRRSARDLLEMGLKFREAAELEQRLAAVEARLAGAVPIPEGGSADGGSAREPSSN